MGNAQFVLQEFLHASDGDPDVDLDDIEELFAAVDVNHDGVLSIDELIGQGSMDVGEAKKLIARLDRNNSGELSKGEFESVILKIDQVLKEQIKAMYSAAQM